jgi:enoyl-CoA hydratase/carnithine racemase
LLQKVSAIMPHRHDTAYGFRLALRLAGTTAEHYVTQGGLDAAAEPYIDAMMTASPVGLRLSKECPNMSVDAGSIEAVIAMEDRNQVLCSRSEEFSEGIRAFLEKRKPVYIKR